MRKRLWSIAVGVAMVVGGGALWLFTRDIETPVIGLHQVGLVVAVLGAVEVVASGAPLVRPSRRRRLDADD